MTVRRLTLTISFVVAILLLPRIGLTQGTVADYKRASGLREKYLDAAAGMPEPARWIGKTNHFWYRRTVKGGNEFLVYEVDTKTKRPAFDHVKLAATLSKLAGRTIAASALPFNSITFADGERAIDVTFDGANYTCNLTDYTCRRQERTGAFERRQPAAPCTPPAADDRPRPSPDGKREAFISNYNVAVRNAGAKVWTILSTDGSEGNCYELNTVRWSPDSAKLVAYRVVPGYRRLVHYVESSPEDQLQPKDSSRFYAKPGDVVDLDQPVLFDVANRKQMPVENTLFPNPYEVLRAEWRKDSSAFTFEFNQRGHQVYRVIEVSAATGQARAIITESSGTFFCYSGKKYRKDLQDGKETIWMSERDGWNHLYLYDGASGTVKNQITKGPWVVRGVSAVDEAKRQIYFSAGQRSLLRALLPDQPRRHGAHAADDRRREPHRQLFRQPGVLRGSLLAGRHGTGR